MSIVKDTMKRRGKIIESVTVRDVQLAIWYYKSSQNLLHNSKSKKLLTPQRLLDYLKFKGMKLSEFGDELTDVEREDNLADDLKDFLA